MNVGSSRVVSTMVSIDGAPGHGRAENDKDPDLGTFFRKLKALSDSCETEMCFWAHSSKPAVAFLLLWAPPSGQKVSIDCYSSGVLWRTNAGSATLSATQRTYM